MAKKYWPSGRPFGWSNGVSADHLDSWGSPTLKPRPVVIDVQIAGEQLPRGQRGALVTVDGEFSGDDFGSLSVGNAGYNQQVLRSTLLLFDKIDTPGGNFINFGGVPELEEKGLSQSTRVVLRGNGLSGGLRSIHTPIIEAFHALNERDAGRWALTRSIDAMGLPDEVFAPNRAIELQLRDAVPLPHIDVSFDEIIGFKERRKSELLALRHFLEDLGLQATQTGLSNLAKTIAFEKVDQALADYNSVMRETNFRKVLHHVNISFQLEETAVGAVVGAGIGVLAGMPLAGAALGAVVQAIPQLCGGVVRGLKSNRMAGKPFEYVFHAHRELGCTRAALLAGEKRFAPNSPRKTPCTTSQTGPAPRPA